MAPSFEKLIQNGKITINGQDILIDDVSWIRKGDSVAVVIDTRYCQNAINIAKGAKMMICESTYLEEHAALAKNHFHLTAKQAATIAKNAGVRRINSHPFSSLS